MWQQHGQPSQSHNMKFIRRKTTDGYVVDKTVTITLGVDGGTDTDTIEDIPTPADTAIEVELDDGSVVILLGYLRK